MTNGNDRDAARATPKFDFTQPAGEPALIAADSVSWRVFKNPVAAFIGGVMAVILELAEPRVRAGVWDHTTFRSEPLRRLRRTGLAAMVTVYGARRDAERMIAGVRRLHDRVAGTTPDGVAYAANEQELLDWVQATASYGFVEAYSAYACALSDDERDRFYAESEAPARLYGALGAPRSLAEQRAQFARMEAKLVRSDTVFEFLRIMRDTPVLPRPLRTFQHLLIRAAVERVPAAVRTRIGLGPEWTLARWQRALVRAAGHAAERIAVPGSPAVQACLRVGLPARYLYRRRRR